MTLQEKIFPIAFVVTASLLRKTDTIGELSACYLDHSIIIVNKEALRWFNSEKSHFKIVDKAYL